MQPILVTDAKQSPRKRMRKGTQCCLNCRRRKIRCIFVAAAQACEACISKDVKCIDQVYGLPKVDLARNESLRKQRSTDIEALIGELTQRLSSNPDDTKCTKAEIGALNALARLRQDLRPSVVESSQHQTSQVFDKFIQPQGSALSHSTGKAPLLSLFNNNVFGHENDMSSEYVAIEPGAEDQLLCTRDLRSIRYLRALVPSNHDLIMVLKSSHSGWQIWQKAFPNLVGNDLLEGNKALAQIHQSLLSHNVAAVAKVLLCLALSIQQLPPEFQFRQTKLPSNSEALEECFLLPVDRLLAVDEEYAFTLEGLECMTLQTRIYVNLGKPYKAWMIFRRAASIANLLALHRLPTEKHDSISIRKRAVWRNIWQGERYLSLILGLPYSTSNVHIEGNFEGYEHLPDSDDERLQHHICIIAGRVIDRDQCPGTLSFSKTLQIDQALEACKESMPAGWWDTIPSAHMSLEAITKMFVAKFSFQNVRKLLHLPFMLQAGTDPRYEFSRCAALDASRQMIILYQFMRDVDRPVLQVCNVADFQVFTAAMIIVLDLFGNPRPQTSKQVEKDWEILQVVMQDLNRAASQYPHSVATQASRVLGDICEARYDNFIHGSKIYQAVIPYFGKLSIRFKQACASQQISEPTFGSVKQLQTSPKFLASLTATEDTLMSFDSYLPFSQNGQPWEDLGMDWNSMVDFNLCNDWS